MGFVSLDKFAEMARADFDHEKFNGVFSLIKNPDFGDSVILGKPSTFMNASGEFVRPLMDYFKIDVSDLLVVYDDMALAPGTIRLRPAGSSGSHKGMQSIIDNLKSNAFPRIRVGIGEPPHGGADWVLGKPKGEERELLEQATDQAALAIRDYLLHGLSYAMNHYNQKGA